MPSGKIKKKTSQDSDLIRQNLKTKSEIWDKSEFWYNKAEFWINQSEIWENKSGLWSHSSEFWNNKAEF